MELTYKEFFLYLIIAQVIIGALLGLIPLILGRKRNRARLGNYGFLATVVGGAISVLMGLIVVCIFVWLILRKKPQPSQTDSENN